MTRSICHNPPELVNASPAVSFKFKVGERVLFLRATWWGKIVARRLDKYGTPIYDIKGDTPADVLFCGELEDTLDKILPNWQTGK